MCSYFQSASVLQQDPSKALTTICIAVHKYNSIWVPYSGSPGIWVSEKKAGPSMSLIFFATPLSHLNWLAEEACIVLCVFVYLCFCVFVCYVFVTFFLPHLIWGGSYCASRKMKHQFDCGPDFFSKTEPRTIFKSIILFFCERLNDKCL